MSESGSPHVLQVTEQDVRPNRQRIFEAALRLLRNGGTEAATLRAICDEAGIKPPTLYHYFGDMHGLYREVVEYVVDFHRGPGGRAGGFTPLERIEDTWIVHIQVARHEPGLFDLWNRHLAWNRLSPTSLRSERSLEEAFERLSGEHSLKVTPDVAAYTFWAAAHGIACLIAGSSRGGVPYPDGAAEMLMHSVLAAIFEKPPLSGT